jgi:hypothetical protein
MTSTPGRAPDRVVKDVVSRKGSVYSPVERFVAWTIADHINLELGYAWPSIARLVDHTGFSERAVRNAVRALTSGPRALFDREEPPPGGWRDGRAGRERGGRDGSSRYRVRRAVLEGHHVPPIEGHQVPPMDAMRGTTCSDEGHQVPGWGAPGAYYSPNRTSERTSDTHPPTPAHERGRPLPSASQLVWQRWLEAQQIGAGGLADKRWRKWCGDQLRTRGIAAGEQLVRQRIARDAEERRQAAAEDEQLAEVHAAARELLAQAQREGQPPGELWTRFIAAVEARVNEHAFGTWFRFLAPVALLRGGAGERLIVATPSAQHRGWIERNYRAQVRDALRDIGRDDLELELLVDPAHAPPGASRAG